MIIITKYAGSLDHLTIALTGMGNQNIYLSFFPADSPTQGFKLHRIKEDQSHPAETFVILPTEESCGFGLSESAIYDWWKNKFNPVKENFSLIFNNCSSIVYRALSAGLQAKSLPSTLKETKWLCTPIGIIHYAEKLNEKIYQQFKNEGKIYLQYHELEQLCDLPNIKNAFTQLLAIDLRLKNFNNEEYNLLLTPFFYENINFLLNTINNNFFKSENNNVDQPFDQLTRLANDIYSSKDAEMILFFEKSVSICLQNFKNTLKKYKHPTIQSAESLLKYIENKIDDNNNPQKLFFKKREHALDGNNNVTTSYYRARGR